MIASVLGAVDSRGIDSRGIGAVLAAEVLVCAAGPSPKRVGTPASEAAFERAPVTMPRLGRLLMGARNLDDRTLAPADAEAALGEFARSGGGAVVALAGRRSSATPAELARLSAASGVAIVRGVAPSAAATAAEGGDLDALAAGVFAELDAPRHPAGVVGLVRSPGAGERAPEVRIGAAATAARLAGAALVLEASPDPAGTERALAGVDAAGLSRDRVILTRVARALGSRVGVETGRLDALLALGTALCFDDLGRIPTVRTIVSDHEIALAVLRSAELGAADRVMLSCGIRNKHRLTAYGGNGLEFVTTQFLPHLRRLGAEEPLLAAVGGGNAARVIARGPGRGGEETA